jgi:vacuolar-type H+-ATPase subunit H
MRKRVIANNMNNNPNSHPGQDQYIQTLKKIKETEDKVQKEIEEYRHRIDQEIKMMEEDQKNAITKVKLEGQEMVEKSIEMAQQDAHRQARDIIANAENKSKSLSVHSDPKLMDEIMKILLSGI